jgi:hypothetical protein
MVEGEISKGRKVEEEERRMERQKIVERINNQRECCILIDVQRMNVL